MMSIEVDKVLINITDTGHSYIFAVDFISKTLFNDYIKTNSELKERKCECFSSYILEHRCSLFKVTNEYSYALKNEGKITKPFKTELIDTYKNIMISDGFVLSNMEHILTHIKNLCKMRIILDTTSSEVKFGGKI
jgi:hypothetical protein